MPYIGKKPADIIATVIDTTTGTFSGDLTVDTNTLYVDSANNRVGIGTASSLVRDLNINGTAANSKAFVRFSHDGLASTGLDVGYSSGGYASISNAENTAMVFSTNATEAMRIDSSGNLLVGKTAAATNVEGGELRENGQVLAIATNVNPFFGARLGSDGDLAVFRKDSTTVGSIGTNSGGTYFAGNGSSLLSLGDAVLPRSTTGGSRNGLVDLGNASNVFANLYLSGGAYIGGTGSANYLDDYEEGSWTPELTFNQGTTGIVYNSAAGSRSGQYVKIGQFVWLWFYFILSNKGTSIGTAEINGIPFTTANSFYNENGGVAHAYSGFTGLRSNITTLVGGSNRIYLNHADATSGSITAAGNLNQSQFTNGAFLRGHVCYKTTQ